MDIEDMRKMEMKVKNGCLKGSSSLIVSSGGFLDVQIDGDTICTVSIPAPNFMAGGDSISEWHEEFHDNDKNNYSATVCSSIHGVECEINIKSNGLPISDDTLQDISSNLTIEIHFTENT